MPEAAERERSLSDKEIKEFWHGLEDADIAPQLRQILGLLLVCGQRRAEVTHMAWSEIDLDAGWWEIPATRTKSKRAHRVPLSSLALELIGEPDGSEYVFHHLDGGPFSSYSVSQAMLREREALGLADSPATPHDLRRTFVTGLSKLGFDSFIKGRLANHSPKGVTDRTYDKYDYAEQKARAINAWGNRLTEIVTGEAATENVVSIRETAK